MPPRALNTASDGTCVLGIRDAGVVELLCDPAAMAVWDVLRASRTVRSLPELSAASRQAPIDARQAVDRLIDAGLVLMRRARGRRSAVGFSARYRSLVIAHEPGEDGALVERVLHAMAPRSVPSSGDSDGSVFGSVAGRFVATAPLDLPARDELHRRIMDVVDYLRSLGMVSVPGGTNGHVPGSAPSIRAVIDIAPLGSVHSSHASVSLLPRHALAGAASGARARLGGANTLTRREWDIAAALAAGGSRPEIAARLGISANTVASIAKSVYRKLGVHSRSELSNRLRTAPGIGRNDAHAGDGSNG